MMNLFNLHTLAILSASTLLLLYFKRKRDSHFKRCRSKKLLHGKVVLITGGSSGLGRQLAIEMVNRGATTVIASPSEIRGRRAVDYIVSNSSCSTPKITWLALDLASKDSLKKFFYNFCNQFTHLDILINNAGVMFWPYDVTSYGVEYHLGVNHIGPCYLTKLFLDMLKQSKSAKVIFISSGKYTRAKEPINMETPSPEEYNMQNQYATSKLANILYAMALDKRFKSSNVPIKVFPIRPGFIRNTELGRRFNAFLTLLSFPFIWYYSITTKQASQTVLHCCLEDDIPSGKLYFNCEIQADGKLLTEENMHDVVRKTDEIIENAFSET
ncbi:Retinol dehydrogenase 12 [Trichinella zimbabwensis]|uniref:Retinol dehydrogenase 12 n=1 Tax=Trichinella zimbabwensis TaxID=268475 RepID=A0A0V1HNE8_9BILA|nr:Retinol dehydrogenase 12 [Trichinella zimbabwensis]